jgi:hypothetical protein
MADKYGRLRLEATGLGNALKVARLVPMNPLRGTPRGMTERGVVPMREKHS